MLVAIGGTETAVPLVSLISFRFERAAARRRPGLRRPPRNPFRVVTAADDRTQRACRA
jgi:hypothetical protein